MKNPFDVPMIPHTKNLSHLDRFEKRVFLNFCLRKELFYPGENSVFSGFRYADGLCVGVVTHTPDTQTIGYGPRGVFDATVVAELEGGNTCRKLE